MMSICLISGNANFDHVLNVVLARFLHYKVTIFHLVIKNYLMGRYFETMQMSYLSSRHNPLILAFINDSRLKRLLLWQLSNGDFMECDLKKNSQKAYIKI